MATEVPADRPQLDPAIVDAIVAELLDPLAQRVVEVMKEEGILSPSRSAVSKRWLDASEVATGLGVTRDWVYEHASELGAIRIGDGRRPRLRFPSDAVGPAATANRVRNRDPRRSSNRRPYGLIPVYDG